MIRYVQPIPPTVGVIKPLIAVINAFHHRLDSAGLKQLMEQRVFM